jgi:thiamine-monophosphate kinase
MRRSQAAARRPRLRQLGEDVVVEKLLRLVSTRRGVVNPAADDAAVVAAPGRGKLLVLKTDCVVEGIHFDNKAASQAIGWKAMMRPLSDFAAMSALPDFALVTLMVRGDETINWVESIYRGLKRAAGKFGVGIVGGETSSTLGPAAISVSVIGQVEKKRWVSRHGGKPGDELFVTGRLGKSIAGKHLRFVPRIPESRWLTANFSIHGMMDLSDGLGADLPRFARASQVGFEVNKKSLPRAAGATVKNAISDGEDYELLFAVSPRTSSQLQKRWKKRFPLLPLTRIGRLTPLSPNYSPKLKSGYIHFK